MTKIDASDHIDHHRRRLFGVAALSAAVAQLGLTGAAAAQTKTSNLPTIKPGTQTSFGPLKQVDAGSSMSAMPNPARPMVLPSFCCTAGLTTFTVLSMLRLHWRQAAIA
jgi:hypothetical protein